MNRIGNGSSIYSTTQKNFLQLTKKSSMGKHSNIEFLALLAKLIVIHGLLLSATQNKKNVSRTKFKFDKDFFL